MQLFQINIGNMLGFNSISYRANGTVRTFDIHFVVIYIQLNWF